MCVCVCVCVSASVRVCVSERECVRYVCTGETEDGECKDYGVDFERVFTRPGEAAMMNCSLVDPRVFNLTHPYNITWYHLRTGLERSSHMGHTIIQGTTLWFFNTTEEDKGEFMCVVR